MKNIRVFLCALALLVCTAAHAEFRWGPTVGANYCNMQFKQDLFTVDKIYSPVGGVTGEMMFPGIGFGIDISALYSMEGAKMHLGEKKIWAVDGYGTENVFTHNFEIPINLRFKWTRMNGLEDKIAPLIFGGPEFSIQVAHGNCDAIDYSGGDLGITCGGGLELFKKWQVTAQYTWGMTYVLKTKLLDNFSARSRQWTIRAAYFF